MAKVLGFEKIYNKQYKVTCDKCGAIILFEEKELNKCNNNDSMNDLIYTGCCPVCNNMIDVDPYKCEQETEPINQKYIDNYYNIESKMNSQHRYYPTDKITNCKSNCKICRGKCLYRYEPYEGQ